MRVVLATSNAGKLREFAQLLEPLALDVEPQAALGVTPAPETGATFAQNALLKARHAATATGLPALADDSGLEVDDLGGRPGVRSARYAGETASDAENTARLLAELAALPPAAERRARFRCAIAFVRDAADPEPIVVHGVWEGRIVPEPRGSGGFGYDPVFEDLATGRTAAELPDQEKNRRSHRAAALRALLEVLRR